MSLGLGLGLGITNGTRLGLSAVGGGAVPEPNNDTHFSFTDFYVQPTGSNLNAGSTTSDAAVFTSAAGDSNGTSVFTPNDGSTPASTVTVGMFGSVYVTAGATVATFVGRITAVAAGVNGAITFSTTAKSGTFPASSAGAHTITLKVGGAWAGPSGAVTFPVNFVEAAMMDSSSNIPHVNYKGGTNYVMTAVITRSLNGPVIQRGYTTTPRDNGQARIKGPTTGASYIGVNITGSYNLFADFDVEDNGATGSASGFALAATTNMAFGVSVHGVRGRGVELNNVLGALVECEAWGCNTSNTTYSGGIHAATAGSFVFRCMSHNNRGGSNGHGITMDTSIYWKECISAYNSGDGYQSNADTNVTLSSCDFYNNGANGLNFTGGSTTMLLSIVNCNFVKNGANGILFRRYGEIGEFAGNRFGAGTMANTTADATTFEPFSMSIANNSSYASDVTPWSDPDNGNLSITLAAAVGAGYGTYTAAFNGFGTNVAYPDVGAAEKSHA